jgi:hypothetical protein
VGTWWNTTSLKKGWPVAGLVSPAFARHSAVRRVTVFSRRRLAVRSALEELGRRWAALCPSQLDQATGVSLWCSTHTYPHGSQPPGRVRRQRGAVW